MGPNDALLEADADAAPRVVRDSLGNELNQDIDCRIEGIGAMGLTSEFVKKA